MTDGRLNRESVTVATQTDGDARLNRESVTVATQTDGDARLGRISVTVAFAIKYKVGSGGGWNVISIS
jgi:hypothetical protein